MSARGRLVIGCALAVAILAAAPSHSVRAQVELSGYVVHFAIRQQNPELLRRFFGLEETVWVNLTRTRLRPVLYLGENTRLSVEYELDAIHLSSQVPYVELGETGRRQVFDWRWEPVQESHYQVQHYLDRLYLRRDFGWGNLIVGRQRISWGTGRVWNPTDFFNPINPVNFEKLEKDGADAVSVKIYAGNFTDLQLVYNVEDRWRRRNIAGRFRTNLGGYDFSLVAGRVDERTVTGGDFAGNLWDAGLRGELAYFWSKREGDQGFLKAVLGADYQFNPKLYGMVEYHFNGEGTTDRSKYEFFRLFRGEILNVARNYLFVQANYQVHPLVLLSVGANSNLDDGSDFWLLLLTYSAGDNTALSVGAQFFRGKQDTEYGFFPESVFAKLEWYF